MEFPHYQEQKEVYRLMLADLETANQLLKSLKADATISDDILFNGDAVKWRKYANSLKVRILMRQSAEERCVCRYSCDLQQCTGISRLYFY